MYIFLLLAQAFALDKILVIDTGLSDKNMSVIPYVSYYEDSTGPHGSVVTSIIVHGNLKNKDTICPVSIDVCDSNKHYSSCLNRAIKNNYDIVNISLSGSKFVLGERASLQKITKKSIVVVAAGNDALDYKLRYPGGHKPFIKDNFYVIGNINNPTSNYGKDLIWVDGNDILGYNDLNEIVSLSGTSMSTALFTHNLIKERCKNESK